MFDPFILGTLGWGVLIVIVRSCWSCAIQIIGCDIGTMTAWTFGLLCTWLRDLTIICCGIFVPLVWLCCAVACDSPCDCPVVCEWSRPNSKYNVMVEGETGEITEKLLSLMTEFRQPLQVQSHLEMTGILVQLGHIQRT